MAFRRIAQNLYPAFLAVSIFMLIPGCSAVVMDNDSPPEAQYAEGERLLGKDRYIEAVERFRILKSRYPYSKYAALASLRIGDAHYKEEAFLEAASAYKIFRELYPRHEEAPYALFRIAESHYNMLPSTTDRDLEPAQEAIAAYQRLLQDFPLAPQAKESEARVKELRGKLAEREAYVGNFYFQRELYQASASRYSFLLDNYPEAAKKDECLYRLAFSLERMGEYRKAESALEELNHEFPAGREEGRRLSLRDKVQAGLSSAE